MLVDPVQAERGTFHQRRFAPLDRSLYGRADRIETIYNPFDFENMRALSRQHDPDIPVDRIIRGSDLR